MLTIRMKRNAFRVLATLAFAAAPAFASLITVNNYNFEIPPALGFNTICAGVGCAYNTGLIPDWNGVGLSSGEGQFGTGTSPLRFSYYTAGQTIAWSNGDTISQEVGATVGIGTVYTLMVDIGQRADNESLGGSADLLIGGSSPHTITATGLAPLSGRWSTFTATYIGSAPDAGASITIELRNIAPGVSQANFDNVSLTGVPEPASFLLIGSALLALKAFRRRRPIA